MLTFRGFAQRGFQGSNVSKVTRTSMQRDDFLNHKTPRCAKPLLPAGVLVHRVCKPMSLLSFTVFVVSVFAFLYFYFQKGRRFFLIQFSLHGAGGSSFASFGLCLVLCGLQMCLHLCIGLN